MTAPEPPEQRDEQEHQRGGAAPERGRNAEMSDPVPPNVHDEQDEWYERTRYQLLLFAAGIAVFVLVLGFALDWYINPRTSTQKKDLVQALGLITAGVAGAVGIYFTWRAQRQARQAQEENQRNTLAQLENAQEQLRLARRSQEDNQRNTQEQLKQAQNELDITRRGQITERFTRAIDQLGASGAEGKKLFEIRLGGIYALERIARESEEDYLPIMEVLTAYVRQHAPAWRLVEGQDGTEDAAVEKKSEEDSGGSRQESGAVEVPAPAPDIQAVMTVLRRRARSFGDGEPEPLDLHETILSGADLSGADLSGAILSGAKLSRADLSEAILLGAILLGADLRGADLRGADLSEAILSGAALSGAARSREELSGEVLHSEAELSRDMWRILLSEANLSEALSEVSYPEANLSGANLSGANLSGAILLEEQLEETTGDENTRLPSNLKPPAHWGVKTDEQTEGN